MKSIKANKTNLNKIIKWSSSRFNEYKKSKVIDRILQAIKKGEDCDVISECGLKFVISKKYGVEVDE